ncbi:hypothetical protein K439DRAFT_485688 [Ramaria rubella]|nr:hypothetical protein K439DRAFT_485688 [Ramaria rubella]
MDAPCLRPLGIYRRTSTLCPPIYLVITSGRATRRPCASPGALTRPRPPAAFATLDCLSRPPALTPRRRNAAGRTTPSSVTHTAAPSPALQHLCSPTRHPLAHSIAVLVTHTLAATSRHPPTRLPARRLATHTPHRTPAPSTPPTPAASRRLSPPVPALVSPTRHPCRPPPPFSPPTYPRRLSPPSPVPSCLLSPPRHPCRPPPPPHATQPRPVPPLLRPPRYPRRPPPPCPQPYTRGRLPPPTSTRCSSPTQPPPLLTTLPVWTPTRHPLRTPVPSPSSTHPLPPLATQPGAVPPCVTPTPPPRAPAPSAAPTPAVIVLACSSCLPRPHYLGCPDYACASGSRIAAAQDDPGKQPHVVPCDMNNCCVCHWVGVRVVAWVYATW